MADTGCVCHLPQSCAFEYIPVGQLPPAIRLSRDYALNKGERKVMVDMTDSKQLCNQLKSLTCGVPHRIANLANASALLWQTLPDINWAGFYIFDGDKLVLGPFQGKPACIEIPLGKGVCGKAAATCKTVAVANVHEFEGHIACDAASNSEIVVPLFVNGALFGVLDVDSPLFNRFTEQDKIGLEQFAAILQQAL